MLSGWLLSALAVAYLVFLFAIAFYGDRSRIYPMRQRLRPYIYGLALGVYCTSWTFYGAVGTASREGWAYLPIYIGPSLVFLFALPFLERLVEVGRAHKVGSIADFIASRFGKSRPLAVLVTLIAFMAAIPYLALQYKAVAASISALTAAVVAVPAPWYRDSALAVALLMALFAVLFGARRVDATQHHEGLMLAIAFESLLKLMAFVAVGLYAWLQLRGRPIALPARTAQRLDDVQRQCTGGDPARGGGDILPAAPVPGQRHRVRRRAGPAARALDTAAVPRHVLGVRGADRRSVRERRACGAAGSDTLILRLPLEYGAPWLAYWCSWAACRRPRPWWWSPALRWRP
jgi:hypothetical protein